MEKLVNIDKHICVCVYTYIPTYTYIHTDGQISTLLFKLENSLLPWT